MGKEWYHEVMKRKVLGFIGAALIGIASLSAIGVTMPEVAYAEGDTSDNNGGCGGNFLGFKPWYNGLCENGNIKAPSKENSKTELPIFVWKIVFNVIFDLTLAIGYFAVAMVIYGGYMYIMSNGDPAKAAKGQKTLTRAVAGVIIAMSATVLVNTVITVLAINEANGEQQTFGAAQVGNILGWAYAMAGLVAVVFIIKSGIDYTMSRGEPGKIQTATRSIIFSVIGLIVVVLAAVITNFVISAVGGAIQ